jgi:hypothetical protein
MEKKAMPSYDKYSAQRRYTLVQIIGLSFLLLLLLIPSLFSLPKPPLVPNPIVPVSVDITPKATPVPKETIITKVRQVTQITCTVPDQKSKDIIIAEAEKVFGPKGYQANIVIDANATPLNILDALPEIFAQWKEGNSAQQDMDNGRLVLSLKATDAP